LNVVVIYLSIPVKESYLPHWPDIHWRAVSSVPCVVGHYQVQRRCVGKLDGS
jgi:rRNA methylases